KVVNVDFARSLDWVSEQRQERVSQILDAIDNLKDADLKSLAKNPPVHDPDVDKVVAFRDPNRLRFEKPAVARSILKMEVVMSQRDDTALSAWEAAVKGTQ